MSNRTIQSFKGQWDFLSNFYPAPVKLGSVTYPTVEHAYQAAKTKSLHARQQILHAETPGQAKRLGQKVEKRKDWDEMKPVVMFELVLQKFRDDPTLKQKLLDTENATLIEGNTWGDKYWGVCDGEGMNVLGNILMAVRKSLRGEMACQS